MKKLSALFTLTGIIILGFGGYQWLQTNAAQEKSLEEAQTIIDQSNRSKKSFTLEEASIEATNNFSPASGETVGILHIPRLESDLPIVEGTDPDELAKGVGHYYETAYPLQDEQIVLSGHNDTVFRHMGELEHGDILTIILPYGEFSYEITNTQIVDADDLTIIKPQGKEVLTLTTCYPFHFLGPTPERYIITALPVDKNQ